MVRIPAIRLLRRALEGQYRVVKLLRCLSGIEEDVARAQSYLLTTYSRRSRADTIHDLHETPKHRQHPAGNDAARRRLPGDFGDDGGDLSIGKVLAAQDVSLPNPACRHLPAAPRGGTGGSLRPRCSPISGSDRRGRSRPPDSQSLPVDPARRPFAPPLRRGACCLRTRRWRSANRSPYLLVRRFPPVESRLLPRRRCERPAAPPRASRPPSRSGSLLR
jgi:hypothetical protein